MKERERNSGRNLTVSTYYLVTNEEGKVQSQNNLPKVIWLASGTGRQAV